MSQQPLNLRRSIQIVRRHKLLFGAVVTLGILLGAAYSVLKPPTVTSTALVALPQASTDAQIATQVVIAGSNSVLSDALPHVSPAMSLSELDSKVSVTSVTDSIISISASGGNAGEAEATANAVAKSYVSYITAPDNPVGSQRASVLEAATSATGTKLPEHVALFVLLGAVAGALVGFVLSLAVGRSERRLRERDAIANSIGVPVLLSIPAARRPDAASWARLFEKYDVGAVHGWALKKTLQQFGVAERKTTAESPGNFSLTVLTLSSDPGAVALGPQLAVFAASLGIPTTLVIGPQQDANATATLRTAAAPLPQSVEPNRPLRVVVADEGDTGELNTDELSKELNTAFAVVVTVVDGRTPSMPPTPRTTATVLGVTAGAATAEQLARAATAAAADGRDIFGILVANPDPSDQTTGRIPRLAPQLRRPLPTRTNDVPTETRR
jgi:capsular polysaccharide biosynthesis protein